nr:hypothetical protein [Tanacetum cinerariifolium]
MDYLDSRVTSSVGAKSISNSELKLMEVSLKSYVKDIFDRIDRNQWSHSLQVSNIGNLASKISIQIEQFGAGTMKPSYESSIRVEIEKINVETLVLGSRNCEFNHALEKVEVNPTSGGWFRELNGLKQISSVKEYYETFISVLRRLQLSPKYGISCFVDGLKEEIQEMVMMFKPQTIHEAYCLAKLQEATLEARKSKKDNEDGQKDLSLVGESESIDGMQKASIEMLNKHKRMAKSRSVVVFAENFEWKPGLEFLSVEKGKKIRHRLNEHGSADMLRKWSLTARVELYHKYINESLEGNYLGKKFKSSRRLQGVINGQPRSTPKTAKYHMVSDLIRGVKSVKDRAYEVDKDVSTLVTSVAHKTHSADCVLLLKASQSVKGSFHSPKACSKFLPMRLGIILKLQELLTLHNGPTNIKTMIISSLAQELPMYTISLPEWLCKDRQKFSGKSLFTHEDFIKDIQVEVQFSGKSEPSSRIDYADFCKSQYEIGKMAATYFIKNGR